MSGDLDILIGVHDGRVNTKLGEIVGVTSTTIWQWRQVLDSASKEQLSALRFHLLFIIHLAVSKILIHICHVKVPVFVFLLLG